MWGLGFVQTIDAAAMDLYVNFRQYSGDVSGVLRSRAIENGEVEGTIIDAGKFKIKDFNAVMAGGIIRF
jgi:hypothetical protein